MATAAIEIATSLRNGVARLSVLTGSSLCRNGALIAADEPRAVARWLPRQASWRGAYDPWSGSFQEPYDPDENDRADEGDITVPASQPAMSPTTIHVTSPMACLPAPILTRGPSWALCTSAQPLSMGRRHLDGGRGTQLGLDTVAVGKDMAVTKADGGVVGGRGCLRLPGWRAINACSIAPRRAPEGSRSRTPRVSMCFRQR